MGGRLRTCIPAVYSRLSYTVGIKFLSEVVTLAKTFLTPWLYHRPVCAAVTLHHLLKCNGHSALKAVWNCIPKLNQLSRKSVLESVLFCAQQPSHSQPGTQELNKALPIFAGAPATTCANPAQPSPPGQPHTEAPRVPFGLARLCQTDVA